ncbi:hypothetical protein A4X06_0g7721 [Tilletia controversa]|uniref:Uncharacterized protein n=1 Tax=Tilletia controversa TaxID=13291 RepID=A0A8X7STY5_9BASI|nr:hypothetical protein CF328_g8291 [Tilletia controversa]KAE8183571.1 hypothetical protein CF335_g8286 [Tilletia laevis]KAE8240948.1 hypothetical protein A4X06_0g7721 [Tilletia controversa]
MNDWRKGGLRGDWLVSASVSEADGGEKLAEICSAEMVDILRLEAGQQTLSFGVIKLPHAAKLKIHGMIERWMLRDQQSSASWIIRTSRP